MSCGYIVLFVVDMLYPVVILCCLLLTCYILLFIVFVVDMLYPVFYCVVCC